MCLFRSGRWIHQEVLNVVHCDLILRVGEFGIHYECFNVIPHFSLGVVVSFFTIGRVSRAADTAAYVIFMNPLVLGTLGILTWNGLATAERVLPLLIVVASQFVARGKALLQFSHFSLSAYFPIMIGRELSMVDLFMHISSVPLDWGWHTARAFAAIEYLGRMLSYQEVSGGRVVVSKV